MECQDHFRKSTQPVGIFPPPTSCETMVLFYRTPFSPDSDILRLLLPEHPLSLPREVQLYMAFLLSLRISHEYSLSTQFLWKQFSDTGWVSNLACIIYSHQLSVRYQALSTALNNHLTPSLLQDVLTDTPSRKKSLSLLNTLILSMRHKIFIGQKSSSLY